MAGRTYFEYFTVLTRQNLYVSAPIEHKNIPSGVGEGFNQVLILITICDYDKEK